MADVIGANYTKEWINEPAEQADPATRHARVLAFYDEFGAVSTSDVLVIAKIQTKVRFLQIQALNGALGAGLTRVRDVNGNLTTVDAGDIIDGSASPLDLVRIADGDTADNLKILVNVLMNY